MANLDECINEKTSNPRKTVVVRLPQLNVDITLRELEYDDVKDLPDDLEDKLRIMLGRMVLRDDGSRAFSDATAERIGHLNARDYRALSEAALRLNGYSKDVQDETIKNSEANPNGASAYV